jgi:hypothetical protein
MAGDGAMTCENCGARNADEFRFREHPLCCECTSALCSWFLDGGMETDPEMFGHLLT